MGARLIDHHGWEIPASFTSTQEEAARLRESAGLADVSWMLKFDLKGFGLKISPDFGWSLGLNHRLVLCDPPGRETVLARIGSLPGVYSTEVTSVYADFLLAGPRSRDVLAKLTSLNVSEARLPNLGCGQSSLAHVHAIVLRQDLGSLPAFHILVSREYGECVWEAILHAGHEFHLAPVGLEAPNAVV